MLDAIITLVLGIFLVVGFLVPFMAGLNTAAMTATDIALLAIIPTFALVMIIYGAIKALRSAKFGL